MRFRVYGDTKWQRGSVREFLTMPPPPRFRQERDRLRNPTDAEVARAIKRVPMHGAGDIKLKYASAPTVMTVTNLQSLASSSTFQTGWGSAWIDNTSNLYQNLWVYGQITAGTTPTAGSVRCYSFSYDGTNSLTFTSAGTPGTEASGFTITDSEQLDGYLVLLWSEDIDTTTNDVYAMPPRSILQAYGAIPRNTGLYVSHNTVATLKSSGNAMYYDGNLNQYT